MRFFLEMSELGIISDDLVSVRRVLKPIWDVSLTEKWTSVLIGTNF